MNSVAALWAVQAADLAVEHLRRRLAEIDEQLGETTELLEARRQVVEGEAALSEWQGRQRSLETEVRDLTARIRAAEQQLMSGRVRNPKELEGMEANVASLRRRRAQVEDEILETMLEVEGCQEELAAHRAALTEVEVAWQSNQAALGEEREVAIAELKAQAATLRRRWDAISAADQELYRSLRSRKSGRALAAVQRGTCQACGMILPTGVVQQARIEQDERVFCPTCGRLLYGE